MDDRERPIGSIEYSRLPIRFMKLGDTTLETPWGEGLIRNAKTGVTIVLDGRELCVMGGSIAKGGFGLITPKGVRIMFSPVFGRRNDIEFSDGNGYISVNEEVGRLPAPPSGSPLPLSRKEVRQMPKDQRPTSIETLDYVQYRIKAGGTLPVPQQDLVAALAMFASYSCLIREVP